MQIVDSEDDKPLPSLGEVLERMRIHFDRDHDSGATRACQENRGLLPVNTEKGKPTPVLRGAPNRLKKPAHGVSYLTRAANVLHPPSFHPGRPRRL
jgi:hypothetical protein